LENLEKYKIKKLSDYKIQLEYEIPIFSNQEDSVTFIDTIKIKVRYRIDPDERRHSNELPTYYPILFKYPNRFIQKLSQKWKIKMKFISISRKSELHVIDGHLISGLYSEFIFKDKNWTRDYLINKILENGTRVDI
jgi:hypothetical protein